MYGCVVVFVFLDTAFSIQQYPDDLPTEKEFRKVQGNPKWIYLLVTFINLCHQMSWTKVNLKNLTKGGKEAIMYRATEKAPTLN